MQDMADNNEQSREVGEISIKVNADMSEAITGFKALRRELRETTKAARETEKALRELEEAQRSPIIKSQTYVDVNEVKLETVSDDIRRLYE